MELGRLGRRSRKWGVGEIHQQGGPDEIWRPAQSCCCLYWPWDSGLSFIWRQQQYLPCGPSSRLSMAILWVALSFIPALVLRVMVGRQGLTSSPHTPESVHPSSFLFQDPSSGRFELWVSHPWDLEVHRPHSVSQATAGILVPRRGPFLSEIWGKISLRVLRTALSLLHEDCLLAFRCGRRVPAKSFVCVWSGLVPDKNTASLLPPHSGP